MNVLRLGCGDEGGIEEAEETVGVAQLLETCPDQVLKEIDSCETSAGNPGIKARSVTVTMTDERSNLRIEELSN